MTLAQTLGRCWIEDDPDVAVTAFKNAIVRVRREPGGFSASGYNNTGVGITAKKALEDLLQNMRDHATALRDRAADLDEAVAGLAGRVR